MKAPRAPPLHTNWSAAGKADYCAIFQQHGLRDFIADEYCK
jgi:hypothetical protein